MPDIERLSAALADRYRLERELGQGGMATVYLAQDLKHDRKVALKVLKPELAAVIGAERFVVEIKTTAALQHPHILPLFDSGTADGFLYYVMPFIDGETLRAKLDRETQLGIDEAVKTTVAVADALDYAHRHGVVHRDIKPENILLHDGRPMVADFGIALALSAAAGGRMTETGMSLGTPHYMSPEQATAEKEITARSDVYSLGSVLYEMLTGSPPHTGASAQQIIMKIVTEEAAPVTKLRKSVPPNVVAAVAKSLEKLPADRFESAKAFAEALQNPSFTVAATAGAAYGLPARRDWRIIGLATGLVAMTALAVWGIARPVAPRPFARYQMALPEGQQVGGFYARIALTPNGSRLVYTSGRGNLTTLWVRERDHFEATMLAGTDAAASPSVSPDGNRVAFYAGAALHAISLQGGPAVTLMDTLVGAAGSAWSTDGYVYADGEGPTPLLRVPAGAGAPPAWFTSLDSASGETDHLFPDALPNGRGVLFTVRYGSDPARSMIAVADAKTGAHHLLVNGVYARYAKPGYLLIVSSDGILMAAPFDQGAMKLTGDLVALVTGVTLRGPSAPDLAVANDGMLVYTIGGGDELGGEPVWVTREGTAQPVAADWTHTGQELALSPDGSELAVSIHSGRETQVWVRQLSRGTVSKLTFEGTNNGRQGWTPDGARLLYLSNQGPQPAVYSRRADGTANAEPLLMRPGVVQEALVTRDGQWLVFREGGGAASNLYARRMRGDTAVVPLADTKFRETTPTVSPDGRWLAYASDETGRPEVYIRPFPDVERGKWLVSAEGGTEPRFSRNGSELFYRNGKGEMVAAEVAPGSTPPIGRQRALFSAAAYSANAYHQLYDVAPDGRFLMLRQGGDTTAGSTRLFVVENFLEDVKAKMTK